MKRLTCFLCLLVVCAYSFAQEVEPTDTVVISLSQQLFEKAEDAYARYFMQKTNPSEDKDELYNSLLESFMAYMQCMDSIGEEQLTSLKSKFRLMRPEFEMAGIHYSVNGDNRTASKFLECYLNIPQIPLFQGERFPRNAQYPAYVFIVAAESHNARDYENAVSFLQEYIELGEKQNQQICYEFLANDLELLQRFDEEAVVLNEGLMNYPNSLNLLTKAIRYFHRRNDKEKMREMLNRALTISPNDLSLKLFKAQDDEANGHFAEALEVYSMVHELNPNNLNLTKQLAFCHYNLAGSLVNERNTASDSEKFQSLLNAANEHFSKVIALLEPLSKDAEVVKNDQRVLYALTDALTQVGRANEANQLREQTQQVINPLVSTPDQAVGGAPNFNEWYKPKLDKTLEDWQRRGEFEPADVYVKRVNPDTRKKLIVTTRMALEAEYIQEYSHTYNLDDLTIKPYDPDHQTFLIQTRQGDIYLKVPLADDEAKRFKDNWTGVKVEMPQFKVNKNGQLLLEKALFTTPYGLSYVYDANEPLDYGKKQIARPEWNDDDLLADLSEKDMPFKKKANDNLDEPINVGESTVDVNIPKNKDQNEKTFALILANENYKNVESVPFALNDGKSFRRYCVDVLGVPEINITYRENATMNEIIDAVDRIKDAQNVYEGMKLLVYYSGHGLPDASTNEAYLVPVDASARNISTCYKLSRFYQELTANNPESVCVFLDCCFSGAKKDGKIMDTAARGVIVTPRDETPTRNMVVFSACKGNETAYPYNNQKHGLFTYFLLKKLQEDKGKTTLKKLSEYVSSHVKDYSFRYNMKVQTPTTTSSLPPSEWGSWRLDK